MRFCICLVLAVHSLFLSMARGQPLATTVQLPTFQVFTVDTTVSVPDRGGMWLGGIGGQRSGRNQFFPSLVGSRPAIGVETGASRMHVTATIMDLPEIDSQVLAEARRRTQALNHAFDDAVQDRTQHAVSGAVHAEKPAITSVAEIRRSQLREQEQLQQQGEEYLQQALAAEQEGKPGAAKIYYQMAARRLSGELQQQALARLTALREPLAGRKADGKPMNRRVIGSP